MRKADKHAIQETAAGSNARRGAAKQSSRFRCRNAARGSPARERAALKGDARPCGAARTHHRVTSGADDATAAAEVEQGGYAGAGTRLEAAHG